MSLPQEGIGYREFLYHNEEDELSGVIGLFTYSDTHMNEIAIGMLRQLANTLAYLYEDPNRPQAEEDSGREDEAQP